MVTLAELGWLAFGTLAAVTAPVSSMAVIRTDASVAGIALRSNPKVAGSCGSTWRLALGLEQRAGMGHHEVAERSDHAGGSLW
jgi:hypothetical protein